MAGKRETGRVIVNILQYKYPESKLELIIVKTNQINEGIQTDPS